MVALERRIGKVTAYRPDAHAAHIHLDKGRLNVGDTLHIRGPHSELEERVDSIEFPEGPAREAAPGDDVGIHVRQPIEEGAYVYRVEDPYDEADASVLDRAFEP